jgi:N-acetylmuramoyl-L-alanine amidase
LVGALLVGIAAGCASPRTGGPPVSGGGVAPARESLEVRVVYPKATDVIQAHDSAFLFGAVRGATEGATLRLDGRPVPLLQNGAWIAWVALPDDSLAAFRLVAHAASDSAVTLLVARIAPRFRPPRSHAAWIDTTSFAPAGRLTLPPGEGIRLAVRAAPGATVRLLLPWGSAIGFVADSLPEEPAWSVRAFATDPASYRLPPATGQYVGWLPAATLCADGKTLCATLEVAAGGDTARVRWPLAIGLLDVVFPPVVVLRHDTAHAGATDSVTAGRAVPHGTYNWFFPTGTTAEVSGRWDDQVRLRLSRNAVAWVNAADVISLAPSTPPPGGTIGSVRLLPGPQAVTLRVPLPAKLPFQVTEEERSLTLRIYGAAADINWMQYGGTDPLVTRMRYAQPTADEVTITLELSRRVWGYRARFDGRDLVLEVRRPPDIDPEQPLRGRTIVLDPGHPPLGATGPRGLREPVATLAAALKAKELLERAGATVFLTRTDSTPVELFPRTRFAELHDADVLVSLHANALPDGVNPFTNNGTSVYYFHPRSAALARALDRALVAELGFHDLGVGRGDYALVRPTWMPSALTEALFIMIPDQEVVLASEAGQWRYARGVTRGIEHFLRDRGRDP